MFLTFKSFSDLPFLIPRLAIIISILVENSWYDLMGFSFAKKEMSILLLPNLKFRGQKKKENIYIHIYKIQGLSIKSLAIVNITRTVCTTLM